MRVSVVLAVLRGLLKFEGTVLFHGLLLTGAVSLGFFLHPGWKDWLIRLLGLKEISFLNLLVFWVILLHLVIPVAFGVGIAWAVWESLVAEFEWPKKVAKAFRDCLEQALWVKQQVVRFGVLTIASLYALFIAGILILFYYDPKNVGGQETLLQTILGFTLYSLVLFNYLLGRAGLIENYLSFANLVLISGLMVVGALASVGSNLRYFFFGAVLYSPVWITIAYEKLESIKSRFFRHS